MTNKLTVSIIGAGNIAGGFDEKKLNNSTGIFSHAGAYTKNGNFVIKNIFDVDKKRGRDFKEYWNVQNIANSENEIINSYQDIISICSPDKFHFKTIKNILLNNSCKTIFIEKPLGLTIEEVSEIYELSKKSKINIVVNFQRHFDDSYKLHHFNDIDVITANCYYIKGLKHIGITMIDTLIMIFGYPKSLYTYNKVYNKEVQDYSYEFIFFYDDFNITVKTVDKNSYQYHIFDIDILTKDRRIIFTDNGNTLLTYDLASYKYSGINVLAKEPIKVTTEYEISILKSIEYLYDITYNGKKHTINTVTNSYNNHVLLDKIIESFEKEKKIILGESLWKR